MRDDYKKAFDKLAPKRSDGELLKAVLGKAENNMEKKRFSKKAIIVPVAAALALTVGTVGAVAAINSEYIRGVFGGSESVVSEIQNTVYEDSDGHVKMTIDEYLTDGQRIYLTMRYTSLDELGEEWLASHEFAYGEYADVTLLPEKLVSLNHGYHELEEQRTETQRCFFALCEASLDESKQAQFTYIMSNDRKNSTMLSLEENVEIKLFKIVGEGSPTEYYMPKCFAVSPLGYTIYGENRGIYSSGKSNGTHWERQNLSVEEINEIFMLPWTFVMADGTRIDIMHSMAGLGSCEPDESNGGCDLFIASDSYLQYVSDSLNDFRMEYKYRFIDPNQIVGLEVGDHYYELEEMK